MKTNRIFYLFIFTFLAQIGNSQSLHTMDFEYFLEVLKKKPESYTLKNSRDTQFRLDSTHCFVLDFEEWDYESNAYYSYNELGQLTTDSTFIWDGFGAEGGTWVPNVKNLYAYNAEGRLAEHILIQWDIEREIWSKDTLKFVNYYDGIRLLKVVTSFYDSENQIWDDSTIDTLIYNDFGLLIGRTAGFYTEGLFVPVAKVEYEYHLGQIILENFAFSFDGGEIWHSIYQELYEYDDAKKIAQITQFYDDETEMFENAALQLFQYDERELLLQSQRFLWFGEWSLDGICDFFYSPVGSTGVHDTDKDSVQILMSNPFNGGQVRLNTDPQSTQLQYMVYQLNGQYSQQGVFSGNSFELNNLQVPGMYVLLVLQDHKTIGLRRFIVAQ
jgi:hypothetical protein